MDQTQYRTPPTLPLTDNVMEESIGFVLAMASHSMRNWSVPGARNI